MDQGTGIEIMKVGHKRELFRGLKQIGKFLDKSNPLIIGSIFE